MKKRKHLLLFFSLFLNSCNETSIDSGSDVLVSESADFSDENSESLNYQESISSEENSESLSYQESVSSEENSGSSIEETSSNVSSEEVSDNRYYYFDKQYTIYINPSVQYSNLYTSSLGNEGKHMNDISKLLVSMLDTYTNLEVYSNNTMPGLSLSSSVKESNNVGADYHLALHSNAGGGKGSEIFYTKSSYNFSKSILDSLNDILPYKTRGLKDGSKALYELKATKASACLLEILFHDEINQAKFIIENKIEIAEAIYEGIVLYFLEK